jgi:hypothetical protein
LKQADLAEAAGISPAYLNLIEHGRRPIGGKRLAAIARALALSPEALAEPEAADLAGHLAAARAEAPAAPPLGPGETADAFAARFPGWASLLAHWHARAGENRRQADALASRLASDPALSGALHETLTAATAMRATAAILAGAPEIGPAQLARFLANLEADGARLADGAAALARRLEAPREGAPGPPGGAEALFAARGWHLPELEAETAGEAEIAALLAEAPGQATLRALRRYREDARAIPLAAAKRHAPNGPGALARATGAPLDAALRRLAFLPGAEAGLFIADGAGAILFRRPIAGFPAPSDGPACPLWPLFRALAKPGLPVSALVEPPGSGARLFHAEAFAVLRSTPPLAETTMLLTPARREGGAALPVGPSCRLCPHEACPARREPSILAPAL